MGKTMQYFPDQDILHVLIREGDEAGSVELSPHITAELDEAGEIIGVEITDATAYVRDKCWSQPAGGAHIQPEYDFSNAERGKFFDPDAQSRIPIYLESDSLAFVEEVAQRRGVDISEVVNDLIIAERNVARRVQ